jgi:transcriptional regulator with XRE-family HTH domain
MTLPHTEAGYTFRYMRIREEQLRGALGQVLANVRESRDLRQSDVLEQSTVAKVESGANFPSWPTFINLCRAYRVTPAEVLTAAEALLEMKEGTRMEAVEPDEREVLKLYRECNAEGRRVFMDRARAVHTLFPK